MIQKLVLLLLSFLAILSLAAQYGCTNMAACNYEPLALVDDGTCTNELVWFIPAIPSSGIGGSAPAILACSAPLGYILADPCCILEVLLSDNYCVNNTWDQTCQEAYVSCQNSQVGCTNPEACNYDSCARLDDGSCTNQLQWYIPEIVENNSGLAAVYVCSVAPPGYVLGDQEAIQAIVTGDSYCLTNTWDIVCQNAYDDLLNSDSQGCTDPEACNFSPSASSDDGSCSYGYFLVVTPSFLPNLLPFYTCDILNAYDLELYVPIPYCCVEDPESFVLEPISQLYFDSLVECSVNASSNTYCSDPLACNYNTTVQISCVEECFYEESFYAGSIYGEIYSSCTGPPFSGAIPLGEKGSCCARNVMDIYNLTAELGFAVPWGTAEWNTYHDCLHSDYYTGCSDNGACNYNPYVCIDDGSCVYPGCRNELAINFNPLAGCEDGSCEFIGCDNYLAINYSPLVTIPNNNSCIFPSGCTYEDATNYDALAITDDGSCIIVLEGNLCLGDLNSDGVVSTGDLNLFLSVFGSVCEE